MKIGQRVNTQHGIGTIIKIETICGKHPRAGVKHDINLKGFKDDILYYFFNEIKKIDKISQPDDPEDFDEIILDEYCPNCGKEYDEIDYEYQICHVCKFDNNRD